VFYGAASLVQLFFHVIWLFLSLSLSLSVLFPRPAWSFQRTPSAITPIRNLPIAEPTSSRHAPISIWTRPSAKRTSTSSCAVSKPCLVRRRAPDSLPSRWRRSEDLSCWCNCRKWSLDRASISRPSRATLAASWSRMSRRPSSKSVSTKPISSRIIRQSPNGSSKWLTTRKGAYSSQ